MAPIRDRGTVVVVGDLEEEGTGSTTFWIGGMDIGISSAIVATVASALKGWTSISSAAI